MKKLLITLIIGLLVLPNAVSAQYLDVEFGGTGIGNLKASFVPFGNGTGPFSTSTALSVINDRVSIKQLFTGVLIVDPEGYGDYDTISDALVAASAGNTIYLVPGTHTVSSCQTIKDGVNVNGAGQGLAIVSGNVNGCLLQAVGDTVIENISVINSSASGNAILSTGAGFDGNETIFIRNIEASGQFDTFVNNANNARMVIDNVFFSDAGYDIVAGSGLNTVTVVKNSYASSTPTTPSRARFVNATAGTWYLDNNIVEMKRAADEGPLGFVAVGQNTVLYSNNNHVRLDGGNQETFGFAFELGSDEETTNATTSSYFDHIDLKTTGTAVHIQGNSGQDRGIMNVMGGNLTSYERQFASLNYLEQSPIKAGYFIAASSTATSTFANGINLSGGCFSIANVCLGSGGGTITGSGSSGQVTFWDGVSSINGDGSFLWDNIGKILTATHYLATGSSTLQNFTATNGTTTNATSTNISTSVLSVTGTTATSSVSTGGLTIGTIANGTGFSVQQNSSLVSIGTSSPPTQRVFTVVSGVSTLPMVSFIASNAARSAAFSFENVADANDGWKMQRDADGTFDFQYSATYPFPATPDFTALSFFQDNKVAVGTTSASAKLSVWGNGVGTNTAFNVIDSASTTKFSILDNGLVTATNLLMTGSTTLQNFTGVNSTTTNATTTSLAAATICFTADTCRTSWPTASSGNVATSTGETAGEMPYWTSTNGTPALLGSRPTTTLTASTPLALSQTIAVLGASPSALSIADAAADGSTKGAATFTAADFNSSSGNISIDYTNGQAASASNKGFLTSADWSVFNNKISSTSIDTSAELAALLTDETGTAGNTVFSTLPTLQGFLSNASSTISALTVTNGTTTNATSTNINVTGGITFGSTPSAEIRYDGTNIVVDPAISGSGYIDSNGSAAKFSNLGLAGSNPAASAVVNASFTSSTFTRTLLFNQTYSGTLNPITPFTMTSSYQGTNSAPVMRNTFMTNIGVSTTSGLMIGVEGLGGSSLAQAIAGTKNFLGVVGRQGTFTGSNTNATLNTIGVYAAASSTATLGSGATRTDASIWSNGDAVISSNSNFCLEGAVTNELTATMTFTKGDSCLKFNSGSTDLDITVDNVLAARFDNTDVQIPVYLNVGSTSPFANIPNEIADFQGNRNDYVAVNIGNSNGLSNASADLIFTNASSTSSTYYADTGFNSGNYSNSVYGIINVPHSLYTFNQDGPITQVTATSSTAGYISWGTGGFSNERMRITSTGNVGIGTTSPLARLSIGGHNAGVPLFLVASSSTGVATSTLFTVASSTGNIGIGTSTPGTLLSLGNTGNDTINISSTATSTFGSGINIRTGCYAINGTCLSTSGGGSSLFTDGGNFTYLTATADGLAIGGTSSTSAKFSVDTFATTTYIGSGVGTDDSVIQFGPNAKAWTAGYDLTDDTFRISSTTVLGTNDVFTLTKSLNAGIGTTTPWGKLSITGNSGNSLTPVLAVASSTEAKLFTVNGAGHIQTGGGTPAVSTCGTSPSISGNDTSGTVTVGSGVVTACTITFAKTRSNTPRVVGVVTGGGLNIAGGYSAKSTSAVTFSFAATIGSGTFDYLIIE